MPEKPAQTQDSQGRAMSEVTPAEGTGASAEAKGKGSKLLIIGAAALGLLLAAGGGGFFLMQSGMLGGGATASAPTGQSYFYELPEMMVNLSSSGGSAEFLKLKITLEVHDESMMSIVEPRMARVLDAFQVYLRELRRSDLEGSAGIYRLKEELHRRVNLAVYPASVDNVLFQELLVQ